MTVRTSWLDLVRGAVLSAAALAVTLPAAAAETVTLDPSTKFQTMLGWEVTADLGWTREYTPYLNEIFDRTIDEIGITRIRVGVFSGSENTDRSFSRFKSGQIDMKGWRGARYATVNDNDDPNLINWDGFDFDNLDYRIEEVVLPLVKRAEARGRKLEINLNYVAFTDQIRGGQYLHTDPEEYAEFILAAFLHLKDKYGIVPDSLEVLLEPDLVKEWSPGKLGAAMAAATRRLKAAGFTPRLIAPSTTDASNAVPWLEGIAAVPGATDALAELSFHRYKNAKRPVLEGIAAAAARQGLSVGMLEYWMGKGRYPLLHTDLTVANAAIWQGRSVVSQFDIDPRRPAGEKLVLHEDVRFNVPYYHNIRPGDVRIGAASSNPRHIDPVAFLTPDGKATVVMISEGADVVTLKGLPAGDYYVSFATDLGSTALATPRQIGAGEDLTAEIPGRGVLAISAIPPGPLSR